MRKCIEEKMFKVFIRSASGNDIKVNLPVSVVISVLKSTGKLPINIKELEEINFEELLNTITVALKNEVSSEILSIKLDKGDKVKVIIK